MIMALLLAAQTAEDTDTAVKVAVLGLIGVTVTGLFTFLTSRYAARKSTKVSEAAPTNERQVDVSEWQALLEQVKGEATRLIGRVDDLETRDEAKRERIDTLESTVSTNRARIGDLERSVAEQQVKYGVAVQYIRDLMAWAMSFINEDNKPPSPPPSIAEDLK